MTPYDDMRPEGPSGDPGDHLSTLLVHAGEQAALSPTTRAFYTEAISNPWMQVADHRAVVDFARAHGPARPAPTGR